MVPAASVDDTLGQLTPLLEAGDIVVDGGNSYYRDDIRRAKALEASGIRYVDCGTSGGVWGLERGYCLMIGGPDDAVARLDPLFSALAPGVAAAARTPGREGEPGTAEQGYLHCGPSGAGHFVKMVHNGIEYGLMAAYAEGLNILHHADVGLTEREIDAETTPLREPELYQYSLDLPAVTEVWRRGSVVASWLLDLTAQALAADARTSPTSPAACPIRARAAGRASRRSTSARRHRSSPRRCTSGSRRAARRISRIGCCRPCASASGATSRRRHDAAACADLAGTRRGPMTPDAPSDGLAIPAEGALDFLALGGMAMRLDPGIVPFRKAREASIHVSGGEYNVAANLADCFGLRTGIATAMVDYPIGDLVDERIRAMGVRPIYRRFAHDGVRGPNIATVYSDRPVGVRAPVVFYNRVGRGGGAAGARRLRVGGDLRARACAGSTRGGIFAALSPSSADLIVEAMTAARKAGAIVSFDLNYRGKIWATRGGSVQAQEVMRRIVEQVDVLVGNEEDLQQGLGIPGPEAATSGLDPGAFLGMISEGRRALPAG